MVKRRTRYIARRDHPGWVRIRTAARKREPTCRQCRVNGLITPTEVIDHIIPVRAGGSDDPANLQGLCRACHKEKTFRDYETYPRGFSGPMEWCVHGLSLKKGHEWQCDTCPPTH